MTTFKFSVTSKYNRNYLHDRPPKLLYSNRSRWWACVENGCGSLWQEKRRQWIGDCAWAQTTPHYWVHLHELNLGTLTSSTLLLTAPIMCSRHCRTPTPLPLFSRWVATGMTWKGRKSIHAAVPSFKPQFCLTYYPKSLKQLTIKCQQQTWPHPTHPSL